MQRTSQKTWRDLNTELRQQTGGWFFVSDRHCDDGEVELFECFVDSDGHIGGAYPHGFFASPDGVRRYLSELLGELQ